jgi:hypothetical protein
MACDSPAFARNRLTVETGPRHSNRLIAHAKTDFGKQHLHTSS